MREDMSLFHSASKLINYLMGLMDITDPEEAIKRVLSGEYVVVPGRILNSDVMLGQIEKVDNVSFLPGANTGRVNSIAAKLSKRVSFVTK